MKNISKEKTEDLINEMRDLDLKIDLLMLKYERIRLELIRRFPNVRDDEEFKPKQKRIGSK